MFVAELKHGWRNLVAAMIGIGLGVSVYTPLSSLFFRALEGEFHWSKSAAAISLVAMPLTALALPLAGWLSDRFGERKVVGLSALCAVASYLALGRMGGSLNAFYLSIIALHVLGCATGPVAYTRLVAADFTAARGTALALALVGIAVGAMLLPPTIGAIIAKHGWRAAYDSLAAILAVGSVVALLLMQPRVRDVTGAPVVEGASLGRAIASAPFWILGVAIISISVGLLGLVSQFQSVFIEKGIASQTATLLISVLGLSVMVSRLAIGRALDLRHPSRWAAAAVLLAAAGAALLLGPNVTTPRAAIAVFMIGCSAGAELDLMAFFCSRFFGLKSYSAIYGTLFAFHYCGIALGGVGYGLMRDRTGDYGASILATTGLLAFAALLLLSLGGRKPFDPARMSVSRT